MNRVPDFPPPDAATTFRRTDGEGILPPDTSFGKGQGGCGGKGENPLQRVSPFPPVYRIIVLRLIAVLLPAAAEGLVEADEVGIPGLADADAGLLCGVHGALGVEDFEVAVDPAAVAGVREAVGFAGGLDQ